MARQLFTCMGAAIRHATHYLNNQRTSKKLLMVITDGEPADVDVRDPQYLRYDTKNRWKLRPEMVYLLSA